MIVGEIRRYLRDNSTLRISRSMRDTAYKVLQAKEAYITQNQREPSVDEIASKANVAKGTLYYNFKSKEEIFNFVISKGLEIWHEKLTNIENLEDEPIEKLKKLFKMQFELLYENRAFFKMVMSQLWGKETRQDELRNKITE